VLVDASLGLYALPKSGIEVKKSVSLRLIEIHRTVRCDSSH